MSGNAFCIGLGVGTQSSNGDWLEVFYAKPVFEPCNTLLKALSEATGYDGGNQAIELDAAKLDKVSAAFDSVHAEEQRAIAATLKGSTQPLVLCILADDDQPTSTPEVYLKLQLISHRVALPHKIGRAHV